MREKSIEIEKAFSEATKRDNDLENIDQEISKINKKEKDLDKFVEEKSKDLPPHSQELIHLYVTLVKEYERQINREDYYKDKEALIIASKNLNDIIFQSGEKFKNLFRYEKYEPFMQRFIDLQKQAKSILDNAEALPEDSTKTKPNKSFDLLSQNIGYQYKNLTQITKDMYHESLILKDDQDSISLPGKIMERIEKGGV